MDDRGITDNLHEMPILKVQDIIEEYYAYKASKDEMMYEMANLLPKRTGLKYQIWYSAAYPGHNPRIKVDLGDNKSIYIQIENHEIKGDINKIKSKELNKIFNWIDLNKEALLRYWYGASKGEIDTAEMSTLLKPVD